MGNETRRKYGDLSLGESFPTKKGKGMQIESIISGDRYLLCPHCKHLELIRNVHIVKSINYLSNPDNDVFVSDVMFSMKCPECHKTSYELELIDYKMGCIIQKLNKIGLITNYCCQGGGSYYNHCDKAYISFCNGSAITIKDIVKLFPLPKTWHLELSEATANGYRYYDCIRSVNNFCDHNPIKDIKIWTNRVYTRFKDKSIDEILSILNQK